MPAAKAPLVSVPALSRVLARAHATSIPAQGLRAEFAAAAGWGVDVAVRLPLAAAAARACGFAPQADEPWLFADPVHLQADVQRVLLLGPEQLAVAADDVRALAGAVSETVADAGGSIEVAEGGRLLFRGVSTQGVELADIDCVAGRDILAFMPEGRAGGPVRALLNAIQMSLHELPCNIERARRGLPEANALWLWGGGCLAQMPAVPMPVLWADAPWAVGLAQHAGAHVRPLPESLPADGGESELMIVCEEPGRAAAGADIHVWSDAIERADRLWIAPALRALMRGRWQQLRLVVGDGRIYTLTRFAAMRLWRRARGLAGYLA